MMIIQASVELTICTILGLDIPVIIYP